MNLVKVSSETTTAIGKTIQNGSTFVMHGGFSTYTHQPSNITTCKARQCHSAVFAQPILRNPRFHTSDRRPWTRSAIWTPAHPYHIVGPLSPHFERLRILIISLDPSPLLLRTPAHPYHIVGPVSPSLDAGAPLSYRWTRLHAFPHFRMPAYPCGISDSTAHPLFAPS
ncbi:hypothetical protein Y032_0160g3343 [Ancylostoma ceylanicum]|uniref:Uncharacterized protein n=1 Tax=Ancylostoma ceylanicum TaxID=53326 RepID=A0A016SYL2_9BILA|nr:hypothetical protein Y032_0160g3343 [Ancylostoma ceylanicum]